MWNMPHMLGGMRFAFGGAVLAIGLFLAGVAVLAINIVVLIKVSRMEKMLKQQQSNYMERS